MMATNNRQTISTIIMATLILIGMTLSQVRLAIAQDPMPLEEKPTATESSAPAEAAQDAAAQANPPQQDSKAAEDPAETKISGTFAPVDEMMVKLQPRVWTSFEVKRSAPHGQAVRPGEMLVEFERKQFDRRLRDLEREVSSAELALGQAELRSQRQRKSLPMDLTSAERSLRIANDELREFLTRGKAMAIEGVKFGMKRSQDYLDYQAEELKQLLKMYAEDDLTEETEEIVLRRTKDEFESQRFYHERNLRNAELTLQYEIPRNEERLEESVRRATIEWERVRDTMPAELQSMEMELVKQRDKLTQLKQELAELRGDETWLTVKSTMEGTVVYGEHHRGKWSSHEDLVEKLAPGGTVKPGVVLMTVVRERPLKVMARVSEKQLRLFPVETPCRIRPIAVPDQSWTGQVTSVSRFPGTGNQFQLEVAVSVPEDSPIVPGMSCDVVLEPAKPDNENSDTEDGK